MRGDWDGAEAVLRELTEGGLTSATEEEDRERVRRIAEEAGDAFRRMANVPHGVSVFGSAREAPVGRWGKVAREIGEGLATAGFAVITGGGPGLMAAANEGARAVGGVSIGLTIDLPHQEEPNGFLTMEVPFHYFFLRKLVFVKYACAFVLLPGGFGTLDELFEALNLRATHRLEPFPVILVGSEYWDGLLAWLRSEGVRSGTLSEEGLELLTVTDDPDEVVREVVACHDVLCRRLGIVE